MKYISEIEVVTILRNMSVTGNVVEIKEKVIQAFLTSGIPFSIEYMSQQLDSEGNIKLEYYLKSMDEQYDDISGLII